jgi:Ni,Fe-hydrogenase III small subunit
MNNPLYNMVKPKATEEMTFSDEDFESLGLKLKVEIDSIFGRSLAIRELDSGSDNSTEIELVNLTCPHYDVERFGVSFVASPRHADVIVITGAVTRNMETAVKKTYDACPSPKFVVAVGDDACGSGIFRDSYATLGAADLAIPVDLRIPGDPPAPRDILAGLLALMHKIKSQRHN